MYALFMSQCQSAGRRVLTPNCMSMNICIACIDVHLSVRVGLTSRIHNRKIYIHTDIVQVMVTLELAIAVYCIYIIDDPN